MLKGTVPVLLLVGMVVAALAKDRKVEWGCHMQTKVL